MSIKNYRTVLFTKSDKIIGYYPQQQKKKNYTDIENEVNSLQQI